MFCPALSRQSGATQLAVYFYARLLRVGRNRVAPEVCADAEFAVFCPSGMLRRRRCLLFYRSVKEVALKEAQTLGSTFLKSVLECMV